MESKSNLLGSSFAMHTIIVYARASVLSKSFVWKKLWGPIFLEDQLSYHHHCSIWSKGATSSYLRFNTFVCRPVPNLSGTISLQSTCNFVLPQMLFLRKQLYCFPKLCFSSASTGFPISSSSTRGARIGILLLVPSYSLPNFRNLSLPPFDSYLLFILKEHSHIQISVWVLIVMALKISIEIKLMVLLSK